MSIYGLCTGTSYGIAKQHLTQLLEAVVVVRMCICGLCADSSYGVATKHLTQQLEAVVVLLMCICELCTYTNVWYSYTTFSIAA